MPIGCDIRQPVSKTSLSCETKGSDGGDGDRESEHDWSALFPDWKACGLSIPPKFPRKTLAHLPTTQAKAFATVRHHTATDKGCLSKTTAFAILINLIEGAQKAWRRLFGHAQLPKFVKGAVSGWLKVDPKQSALQSPTAAASPSSP